MKNLLNWSDRPVQIVQKNLFVFFVYLLLPYIFFAMGVNVIETALAPGDGAIFGVPTKVFSAYLHLWNPYIQGGTFAFKDIGWQSLYLPGILIMRLFPNPFGYNLLLLFHYTAAGFFTFLFLKKLGLKYVASFIGGITFMFCGFLTAHKGHHSIVMTAAYLPILLYFIENLIGSSRMKWLSLAALAFGLSILADYTAVSMYIGMVAFPYITFRVFGGTEFRGKTLWQKTLSIAVFSLITFVGGMMFAAVQILPILESLKYVTRQQISLEFFTSYSFSLKLLPLMFFPYIYGATSSSFYQTLYFGPWNLTELAGYMGILPLLFVVLCFLLFRRKDRQVYFWTAVFLFALLLVLGDSTPLYKFLYRVPVYNLFRAPARNWLEVNFAAAVLTSFFVHYLITDATLRAKSYYQAVHGVIAALVGVVFSILAFGKFFIPSPEELQRWSENTRLASPAVYVPLIIITLSILLVYVLFQVRHNEIFWTLISITIFIDLFSFGHFHGTGYANYKIFQKQSNLVAMFLDATNLDRKSYRILPLNMTNYENQLYPSVNLLYGFSAVNGYSPIWLKDYANLTGFGTDGTVVKPRILYNSSILSVLSTKYIITANPADKAVLESIRVNGNPGSDRTIVDGFHDKAWSFLGPAAEKSESVILAARESVPTSLIQYSFVPSARTTYKITFSARTHKFQKANDILVIDLYGEGYDLPDQDIYIEPSDISSDFRNFTVYLYSGEQPPTSAFLRFFTYSTFPYEIKDIKFVQSGGYTAYWGDKPSSGARFPLYEKKYESPEGIAVYENLNFLPRARFVKELIPVPDTGTAIYALRYSESINPSDTAFAEDLDFAHKLDDGQVIQADYSKDSAVTLSVRTGEYSFLVLSDSWYPGWKAFVDGEETKIYKTNAVSRGILIEGAGMHQVQFRFVPVSLYIGLGITSATTIVMIIAILMAHITSFDSKRQGGRPDVRTSSR